ncbi:uncharacterized protein G2W53_005175 [Senna tora]|uniref:Uncharacterized protein n=1 Tax=Senna tora TaxID=362788 RepID=A0A834XDC1_9FABA|nr:uncharacterized protein G2W53_005175 [Senna tora]
MVMEARNGKGRLQVWYEADIEKGKRIGNVSSLCTRKTGSHIGEREGDLKRRKEKRKVPLYPSLASPSHVDGDARCCYGDGNLNDREPMRPSWQRGMKRGRVRTEEQRHTILECREARARWSVV